MRPRHSERGFTLIEVVVAATLIATVLLGMGSVMMNYTTARNKISALAVAQNIVQSEIDDVLMRTQIENSLVSDSQGRSRPIYLENGNASLLVSNYWYLNFPRFPDGVDHNKIGQTWGVTQDTLIKRFVSAFPGDLFSAGGALLGESDPTEPEVAFIARLQLYGAKDPITNVETYINGATSSANPRGLYVDTEASPIYRIADTCTNKAVGAGTAVETSTQDPDFRLYKTKILVVRVYEKKHFFNAAGNPSSFIQPGGGSKPIITQSYAVFNGRIRL